MIDAETTMAQLAAALTAIGPDARAALGITKFERQWCAHLEFYLPGKGRGVVMGQSDKGLAEAIDAALAGADRIRERVAKTDPADLEPFVDGEYYTDDGVKVN